MANRQTIFVFGSNREGRHGKGAALDNVKLPDEFIQVILENYTRDK